MSNSNIEIISREKMFEHASVSVIKASQAKIPGVESWSSGTINKTPQVIFDLNDTPLFYDFTVRRGTAVYGTARMAASRLLGTPAVSYELGARTWNLKKAVDSIKPALMKEYSGSRILSSKLVCYSYPKIGVKFELITGKKEKVVLIYDAANYSLVPQIPLKPGVEGNGTWSFYDSISEAEKKTRTDVFNSIEKANDSMIAIIKKNNQGLANLGKAISVIDISKYKLGINIKKELTFCTHYNYDEARSHRCFVLHAQQKGDYCAVATCQMILDYYRYYYSQDEIAPGLGYSGGGCPTDQSAGYESLSNSHIVAKFDDSATWEEAKSQIDGLHPMKSGIAGHARACAGYSCTSWLFPHSITNKKLLIYDPWPWNADYKAGGAVYWENWDAVNHTNFIYTKLDY